MGHDGQRDFCSFGYSPSSSPRAGVLLVYIYFCCCTYRAGFRLIFVVLAVFWRILGGVVFGCLFVVISRHLLALARFSGSCCTG